MNAKNKSYRPEYVVKDRPRVKTLGMWFSPADHDLTEKVKRAFDLAKSGGQELNLTFSLEKT
jgi:hypothetical protein